MTIPFSFGNADPNAIPRAPNMAPIPFDANGFYSPPPPPPSFAARFFGGGDPMAGGYFDRGQANAMGSQALRNAGLAILDASAPHPFKPQLGQILAAGVRGGDQSYQEQSDQAVQHDQIMQKLQMYKQRAAVFQHFAPPPNELPAQRAERMAAIGQALLAAGDTEGAKAAADMMKYHADQAHKDQVVLPGEGEIGKFDPTTGTYTQIKPGSGINEERLQMQRDMMELRKQLAGMAQQGRENANDVALTRIFNRQNQSVIDTAHTIEHANTMMAAARSGNPAATKSAMLNFVRVADVNPQLRLGVLQFLSNIDPSLAGMSEREIFLKWNGTIPPDQLQNLQKIIDATYKENYARYDRQWSYMHSKHPTADITPPEVLFGKWNGAGSSTDGSTPAGDAPGAAAQRARDALKP